MERPYSPGMQLLILLALTISMGFCAQVVFSLALVSANSNGVEVDVLSSPWVLIGGGFCFQLFAHFVSFFLFLRITKQSYKDIISSVQLPIKFWLLLPVVLVICFYTVEFFGWISSSLFESAGAMRYIEDELVWQKKYAEIFTHKDPFRLLASLITLAVMPAIGEELIYRGILFSRLKEATQNHHFAAIVSGIIFASMHSQPVQLLPIAIMGALFAYVYHYTKNIWYSVLLHLLINGLQITAFYFWPNLMT